ncbi:2-oxoacid:acceptor oxidoreductase subunit alpha [Candidatus Shapirobacteria bacterium]|nr:2-oxoacid:acceptor oxidoreductase subunit alpha [Candidatus Shapirobacteria bacterium]
MKGKVTTIKIVGPAGLGIKTSGLLLSHILLEQGYSVHDYSEYPSLIRGGHNTYQLSFSSTEVKAPFYQVNLLFSLAKNHFQPHLAEMKSKSLIFSDEQNPKVKYLPLEKLAKKAGNPVFKNTICLGVAVFLLDLNYSKSQKTLKNFFPKKVKENLKAFQLGYEYASKNYSSLKLKIDRLKNKKGLTFNDGNEAFGWGFLKGRGDFYAAYPMTPSTGTLHFLAAKAKEYKINVRHAEDEIGVANMAAGAAFAGARSAVGTSGGGFALMSECISFCGITEIGMVFYLVQRVGPATGMPTWTAQGDLLFYVFSGHGEFPKIVLAPGDQEESFEFGWKALNLAENLQTPIIVISDKFLGESSKTTPDFNQEKPTINRGKLLDKKIFKGFARYETKYACGRSYRTIPGVKGGEFLANSYEHDKQGFSTEDPQKATQMMEKRMRKLKTALRITPKPQLYGPKNYQRLIISWGSTKGPILEAMKLAGDQKLAFLQIRTLWPLHSEVKKLINQAKKIIIIENNQTSQLTTLLKAQFDFKPTKKILKFNGRPFFPEELYEQFK